MSSWSCTCLILNFKCNEVLREKRYTQCHQVNNDHQYLPWDSSELSKAKGQRTLKAVTLLRAGITKSCYLCCSFSRHEEHPADSFLNPKVLGTLQERELREHQLTVSNRSRNSGGNVLPKLLPELSSVAGQPSLVYSENSRPMGGSVSINKVE